MLPALYVLLCLDAKQARGSTPRRTVSSRSARAMASANALAPADRQGRVGRPTGCGRACPESWCCCTTGWAAARRSRSISTRVASTSRRPRWPRRKARCRSAPRSRSSLPRRRPRRREPRAFGDRGDVRRRHRRLRRRRAADPRRAPGAGHAVPRDRVHRGAATVPRRRPAAVVGGAARRVRDRPRRRRLAHAHPRGARPAAARPTSPTSSTVPTGSSRTGSASRALDFAYPKALAAIADGRRAVRGAVPFGRARRHPARTDRGQTDVYRLARSPIQRSDGEKYFERKVAGGMGLEDALRRPANRWRYRGSVLVTTRVDRGRARDHDRHQPRAAPRSAARAFPRRATRWSRCRRPDRSSPRSSGDGIRHVGLEHASRVGRAAERLRRRRAGLGLPRAAPDIVHTHNPKPGIYGRIAARVGAGAGRSSTRCTASTRSPTTPSRKRARGLRPRTHRAFCSHAELIQNPEDLETLARLGVPAAQAAPARQRDRPRPLRPGRHRRRRRAAARAEMGARPRRRRVRRRRAAGVGEGLPRAVRGGRGPARAAPRSCGSWSVGETITRRPTRSPADDRVAAARRRALPRPARRRGGLYGAFDVYVLASHREGFPRSPMEAAAMGVPDRRDRHPRLPPGRRRRRDRPARDPCATRPRWPARSRRSPPIPIAGCGWERRAREGGARVRPAACVDITLDTYRRLLRAGRRRCRRPRRDRGNPAGGRDHPVRDTRRRRRRCRAARDADHGGVPRVVGPAVPAAPLPEGDRSARSFVLVADDGTAVCGFVAVCEDTGALYRNFLLHDGAVAAFAAAPASPAPRGRCGRPCVRAARRRWRLAGRGDPRDRGRNGVRGPRHRCPAGARRVEELGRRGVHAAHVVTAVGNVAAVRGVRAWRIPARRLDEVHRGVAQELLMALIVGFAVAVLPPRSRLGSHGGRHGRRTRATQGAHQLGALPRWSRGVRRARGSGRAQCPVARAPRARRRARASSTTPRTPAVVRLAVEVVIGAAAAWVPAAARGPRRRSVSWSCVLVNAVNMLDGLDGRRRASRSWARRASPWC